MAVSGRKLSDIRGSMSHRSTEDMDHFCDPCLTTGQQVDADKHCVDCDEYLCKICSDYHLRTKALRNHRLVDKDKVDKQCSTLDYGVCTEKCPEHKQEVIKYFCPHHEALGCYDCMTVYHRTCEIDYIPAKCVDVANSKEYRVTVHRLALKLQQLNEIAQTTKVRDQQIDKCYHNLLEEIIKFRKEINDCLDQLQQKIKREADKKKTEDKQITQRILDGCNSLSSDIKKMQSTLQASKTAGKYGQLYITVKQAQTILKSDEIKVEDGLERTAQQYKFECNNSLINMLSKQDAFGKLSLKFVLKTHQTVSKKEDINIRTTSDKYDCWITGCTVLSSNRLVLTDYSNTKVKLMNIHTKSVVEEKSLDSKPWDVTAISQNQIAVMIPDKRQVVIMTCDDRLSTVCTISVTGECCGITYHHGQLYVVCVKPVCVLVLDKQGNEQNKLFLNKEIFSTPDYLVVSEDSKLLYISDWNKDCVVSITLQGEVTAVYKHEDMKRPQGMLVLHDGSLLVCCRWNHTIHSISVDLKQGQTVIGSLLRPHSIVYNQHLHEVYIGGNCDHLTVLIPEESRNNMLQPSSRRGLYW